MISTENATRMVSLTSQVKSDNDPGHTSSAIELSVAENAVCNVRLLESALSDNIRSCSVCEDFESSELDISASKVTHGGRRARIAEAVRKKPALSFNQA